MPTSVAGTSRPRQAALARRCRNHRWRRHRPKSGGFTLIEILVVVAIVAIMVAVAVVSLSGLDGRRLEREAQRFAALARLACEQSELSGRELGMHLASDGYGFSLATAQGWAPFADNHRFGARELDGVVLQLAGTTLPELPDFEAAPQALCWPSGELSALDLRFVEVGARPDVQARLRVRTGADAQPWVEVRDEREGWRTLAAGG
ncbi:MAG: prepilin-type N-terminal cleavage/methylation domain-containing protein [Lysobacterales bacterium]